MSDTLNILTEIDFDPASLQKLREAAQANISVITDQQEFVKALHDAEIVCGFHIPDNILEIAPHLRWFQNIGAGLDKLASTGLLAPDSRVIVTRASGIHITQISEYVFGTMLLFNRSWPAMLDLQKRHIWPNHYSEYHLQQRELSGRTLGIVGLGSIGRGIAHLGRAFGMKVIASRFSTHPGTSDPDVDALYTMEQLHTLLNQSDYVVLAVPLTERTENLIGEAELRAMQPHTYLVNIARGRVIDEAALLRALQEGWIAGAGLDVAVEEPLPPESPLFDAPNLILSPHISGASDYYNVRLADLFAENLQRYRAGQPLRNQYDPAKGY
jgi:phosphoglycerate dehydrogenase-like enzyme